MYKHAFDIREKDVAMYFWGKEEREEGTQGGSEGAREGRKRARKGSEGGREGVSD